MKSEWDPILTSHNRVYLDLRLNGDWLEIKLPRNDNITIQIDAKAIPSMIKILQRMEKRL